MEYSQYDMEYLVSQYEMLEQVYQHPDSLGKERIEKMKLAFDSFDKDGNGNLDRDEAADLLKMHFKDIGINKVPTQEEIDEFFNKLDEDRSNTIEFKEFKVFMLHNVKRQIIKPLADYLRGEGFNLEETGNMWSWSEKAAQRA